MPVSQRVARFFSFRDGTSPTTLNPVFATGAVVKRGSEDVISGFGARPFVVINGVEGNDVLIQFDVTPGIGGDDYNAYAKCGSNAGPITYIYSNHTTVDRGLSNINSQGDFVVSCQVSDNKVAYYRFRGKGFDFVPAEPAKEYIALY